MSNDRNAAPRNTDSAAKHGEGRGLASRLAQLGAFKAAKLQIAGAERRAGMNTRKPARILVVDDEAHVRSMIAATLERQGYDVLLASGGREAFE